MERLTEGMLNEIAEYFEFDVQVRGDESEVVERGRILLAEVERLHAQEERDNEERNKLHAEVHHWKSLCEAATMAQDVIAGVMRDAKAEVERLQKREKELVEALRTTAQNVHLLRLPQMGPHTMKTVADTIENAALAVLEKGAK